VRNQRQTHAAQNGGHGGAARHRSRWGGYGLISETEVEPEPASESVDETNEVVNCSSASPSSSAAAALAAVGLFRQHHAMAHINWCSLFSACQHQISANTGSASPARNQCCQTLLQQALALKTGHPAAWLACKESSSYGRQADRISYCKAHFPSLTPLAFPAALPVLFVEVLEAVAGAESAPAARILSTISFVIARNASETCEPSFADVSKKRRPYSSARAWPRAASICARSNTRLHGVIGD
jgi:hypothetical protein